MQPVQTMEESRIIRVVALACVQESKLLLVRKRGLNSWILPGGKPEDGEGEEQTLQREIGEELNCRVENLNFIASIRDKVAGQSSFRLDLKLWQGSLAGSIHLGSEICSMMWYPLESKQSFKEELAPSLTNQIIPMLRQRLGID